MRPCCARSITVLCAVLCGTFVHARLAMPPRENGNFDSYLAAIKKDGSKALKKFGMQQGV